MYDTEERLVRAHKLGSALARWDVHASVNLDLKEILNLATKLRDSEKEREALMAGYLGTRRRERNEPPMGQVTTGDLHLSE